MRDDKICSCIKTPKANVNLLESYEIFYGNFAFVFGQDKNRDISKIAISMCLSHAFSPVVKFYLKCTHRRSNDSQEFLNPKGGFTPSVGCPGYCHQICYTKSIDCYLPCTCDLFFGCPMVNFAVLFEIGFGKFYCKACLGSYYSWLSPWEIEFGLVKSDFWDIKYGRSYHNFTLPKKTSQFYRNHNKNKANNYV